MFPARPCFAWVHFKFSLLLLLVVAFGGGFFHFCPRRLGRDVPLDTKVEQKIKAA
jgi:hypothetical protein